MSRPIGVTMLAAGAALIGIYELYRTLIFMGIASFNFGLGNTVEFNQPQWGQVFWSLVLAAIWFWEAKGFWELRAYAYSFGVFIALFTLIWGFTALLFGSSVEAETVPWFLALVILLYLQYPGVQQHFDLLSEPREVGRIQGRLDLDSAGPVTPGQGGATLNRQSGDEESARPMDVGTCQEELRQPRMPVGGPFVRERRVRTQG